MADSRDGKSKIYFWITPEGERDLAVLVANIKYERRGEPTKPTKEMILGDVMTVCSQVPPGKFRDVENYIRKLKQPAPPADLSTKFQKPPRLGKKRA